MRIIIRIVHHSGYCCCCCCCCHVLVLCICIQLELSSADWVGFDRYETRTLYGGEQRARLDRVVFRRTSIIMKYWITLGYCYSLRTFLPYVRSTQWQFAAVSDAYYIHWPIPVSFLCTWTASKKTKKKPRWGLTGNPRKTNKNAIQLIPFYVVKRPVANTETKEKKEKGPKLGVGW